MSNRNNSKTSFYAVLVLLIAALAYIVFTKTSSSALEPTEVQKQEVAKIFAEREQLLPEFESLVKTIKAGIEGEEKSQFGRLGNDLIETIHLYQQQLHLINHIENTRDSVQINEARKQVALARKGLEHSKKLFESNEALQGRLSLVGKYEHRIDSLKQQLEQISESNTGNQRIANALKAEIRSYENKLNRLLKNQDRFQHTKDSLISALQQSNKTLSSVSDSLRIQKSLYSEMVEKAAKDAKLATEATLWYFEKDNLKRPKRRLLENEISDYNRGSEIKTIYGVFTVSQFDFKPFEIATVYLDLVEGTDLKERARVKVSVRDQVSGEFSLLPTEKLKKGTYRVRVEYGQKIILTKDFHVTQ